MPRVAFAIHRMGENKSYAPLMHEALKRGWPVEVWIDQHDISKTTKWYEFPEIKLFPDFGGLRDKIEFKAFVNQAEYLSVAAASQARIVFSEYPPEFEKPAGQKWMHVISCLYDSQCAIPAHRFSFFDTVFANSRYWVDEGIEYYRILGQLTPELEQRFRSTWVITGTPQFDHSVSCDRQIIREKLGIPEGKGVVTVFAFEMNTSYWSSRIFLEDSRLMRLWHLLRLPFSYPNFVSRIGLAKLVPLTLRSLWDRLRYLPAAVTSASEKETMEAIRAFCDHNNAVLVMKARRKHPLLPHQKSLPDVLLDRDTEFYPFTGAQAIAAADLMITFFSTAAAESVAGGVPVINLLPPQDGYYTSGQFETLFREGAKEIEIGYRRFYNSDPGGVFGYPGAVTSRRVNEFVKNFPAENLRDFKMDAAAMRAYEEKHLGGKAGEAVIKIMNWVEKSGGSN